MPYCLKIYTMNIMKKGTLAMTWKVFRWWNVLFPWRTEVVWTLERKWRASLLTHRRLTSKYIHKHEINLKRVELGMDDVSRPGGGHNCRQPRIARRCGAAERLTWRQGSPRWARCERVECTGCGRCWVPRTCDGRAATAGRTRRWGAPKTAGRSVHDHGSSAAP